MHEYESKTVTQNCKQSYGNSWFLSLMSAARRVHPRFPDLQALIFHPEENGAQGQSPDPLYEESTDQWSFIPRFWSAAVLLLVISIARPSTDKRALAILHATAWALKVPLFLHTLASSTEAYVLHAVAAAWHRFDAAAAAAINEMSSHRTAADESGTGRKLSPTTLVLSTTLGAALRSSGDIDGGGCGGELSRQLEVALALGSRAVVETERAVSAAPHRPCDAAAPAEDQRRCDLRYFVFLSFLGFVAGRRPRAASRVSSLPAA